MWASNFLVVGVILVFANVARAGDDDAGATQESRSTAQVAPSKPPETPAPATELPEYDDYRLTLLAVDAGALSLILAGAFFDDEDIGTPLILGGVGTYALGGPSVHLAHKQSGRALGSFGLRVGLPAIGFGLFAGMALSCPDTSGSSDPEAEGWCVLGAALFGGVVMIGGVVTALIVDDGFLGKAPKVQPKDRARRTSEFRASVAPLFDPKKRSVGLSLVGTF